RDGIGTVTNARFTVVPRLGELTSETLDDPLSFLVRENDAGSFCRRSGAVAARDPRHRRAPRGDEVGVLLRLVLALGVAARDSGERMSRRELARSGQPQNRGAERADAIARGGD